MIKLLYKSKLLRESILYWLSFIALLLWAVTATAWAVLKSDKTVLIGIDEAGTRIITTSSDRLVQSELKAFLKYFFEMYYSYNELNFNERMSLSTDLFSNDLWALQRDKIAQLGVNLKKTPLSQSAEIQSIDRIDNSKIEAILLLTIRSRMSEQKVRLKVILSYRRSERTEKNPWGYEVDELSDATL
ncbi:VirB8/TrbF family protein [Bdellovibrio svalbardensis]|uniref:Type IV conjugative transfer system protein TraE n=1 Tax=Bdellovibrio svalbardensis TaxID=2972972 RepID=A0ABT6DJU2_9BACT|nr:VirB8/TrbF family protein [Bdellovibrio svalbardensis]MDG0816485.1 hypothetical protein [Bdellovibrio svalbardensis]